MSAAVTPTHSPTAPTAAAVVATRKPAVFTTSTPTVEYPLSTHTPITIAQLCSPLDGIARTELEEIVSFPYDPPALGKDDGHHGVDFAYYRRGEQPSIEGLPVRSTLTGTVAAVISDRPPYGNLIIIETPLDRLPEGWITRLDVPTPQPPLTGNPRLTCPPVDLPAWDSPNRSLYLLYGHLEQAPSFTTGDTIECGQLIGTVGNTGMSGNPHLHLEVRVGPGGTIFPGLAHYDNAALPEEMAYYCAWRVSGLFQLMDPLALLRLQ